MMATRLEKSVEPDFFSSWSALITKGARKGDGYSIAKYRTAPDAANTLVRELLKSPFDSILFLDSDAEFDRDFLNVFRDLEDGWQYDVFQAYYPRRGWPPEAIWFKETSFGDLVQCLVWKDDHTEEVALVGLHATLIRREVFQTIKDASPDIPLDEFEWFWYPRHEKVSEDAAFSKEARKEFGFTLGATTKVKTAHISKVSTGWETYIEYLHHSGAWKQWEN